MRLTKRESALVVQALARRMPRYTFEHLRQVLEHVALLKMAGREAELVFRGLRDFCFDAQNELVVMESDVAIARPRRAPSPKPRRMTARSSRPRPEVWEPAGFPLFDQTGPEVSGLSVH